MKIYTLKNEYQEVDILNYGATITRWIAFSDKTNIILSNEIYTDYLNKDNAYLSSTIGRVAGRIAKGNFKINDMTYQLENNYAGNNHGHGGLDGFFKQKFELVSQTEQKLVLSYFSKNLESGYPGNIKVFVTYELFNNTFEIRYDAKTDQDTILNLTNHSYFNLDNNEKTIENHTLKITSDNILDTNSYLVPTGKLIDVSDTNHDFRRNVKLGDVLTSDELFNKNKGLDDYYLFNNEKYLELSFKKKKLTVITTYPGVVVYSANYPAKQKLIDREFTMHAALAIEPQYEPDAINHSNFSDIVLKKDQKYHETIKYIISEN